MIENAQETAKKIGLTEEDINTVIKETRAEKQEAKMRIVADTNVIASAIYFGGKPFELLKLIMEERISAIASKDIIEEYEEILARLQYRHDYLWWRDTYCLSGF